LDAATRRLELKVSDEELARRRAQWRAPPKPKRGYARLYVDRVMQAEQGCDFDFLRAAR
ncbi:MAG TPA: dihydroxy-acid dehydratase, partial [Xanthobacteraceae bacterium]|nr:dihydroxy-acid dehydratase [Xanthobacteraceae bacterium]